MKHGQPVGSRVLSVMQSEGPQFYVASRTPCKWARAGVRVVSWNRETAGSSQLKFVLHAFSSHGLIAIFLQDHKPKLTAIGQYFLNIFCSQYSLSHYPHCRSVLLPFSVTISWKQLFKFYLRKWHA